jgi:hypothetical protein
MPKCRRRSFTPQFKAQVVLEVDFPTNGERRVNGYPARSYSSGDR